VEWRRKGTVPPYERHSTGGPFVSLPFCLLYGKTISNDWKGGHARTV